MAKLIEEIIKKIRIRAFKHQLIREIIFLLFGIALLSIFVLAVGAIRYALRDSALYLSGIILLGYLIWRGLTVRKISEDEVGLYLDQKLGTKERIISYLTIARSTLKHPVEDKIRYIKSQLDNLIKDQSLKDLMPFKLDTFTASILYSLPIISFILAILYSYLPSISATSLTNADAQTIALLIEESKDLPNPLKESLISLATALEENEITDTEVKEAINLAERELEKADKELTQTNGKKNDPQERKTDASSPKYTATPTPPPTPTPSAQNPTSKKSEDRQLDEKGGGSSASEKSEKDGGNGGESSGDSQSSAGTKDKAGSQDNKSDKKGKGSTKDGQEGLGEGQGQGDNKGDGDKEGKDGSRGSKGGKTGDSGSEQLNKEQMNKIGEKLAELSEKINQESKGDKSANSGQKMGKGGEKKNNSEANENPPSDSDKRSGEMNSDSTNKDQKSKGNAGAMGAGADKNNQDKKDLPDKDNNLPTGASLPKEGEAREQIPGDQGEQTDKLAGKKGFKDIEIRESDEKIDVSQTDNKGNIIRNKREAEYKTSLSDAKLAKPEIENEEEKQPIPLEYKDLIH